MQLVSVDSNGRLESITYPSYLNKLLTQQSEKVLVTQIAVELVFVAKIFEAVAGE